MPGRSQEHKEITAGLLIKGDSETSQMHAPRTMRDRSVRCVHMAVHLSQIHALGRGKASGNARCPTSARDLSHSLTNGLKLAQKRVGNLALGIMGNIPSHHPAMPRDRSADLDNLGVGKARLATAPTCPEITQHMELRTVHPSATALHARGVINFSRSVIL